jgi:hypothetical protein
VVERWRRTAQAAHTWDSAISEIEWFELLLRERAAIVMANDRGWVQEVFMGPLM